MSDAATHTRASWELLAAPRPQLVDARLQAHHAAQVVAAVGFTHLPRRSDDGHPNLEWCPDRGALLGRVVQGDRPFRAGLRLADLTLLFADGDGSVVDTKALEGVSVDAAYAWLDEAIASRTPDAVPLRRPGYEIPGHAVGAGRPFAVDADSLGELARWYANARTALTAAAAALEGASDVRCWPHHFDLGALAVVEADADAESSRTIGLGMTPGDGSYADPYWYVTPWPYPDDPAFGPLASGGQWHTEGWTGAVLTSQATAGAGDAAAQAAAVHDFLDSAIEASRALIGAGR